MPGQAPGSRFRAKTVPIAGCRLRARALGFGGLIGFSLGALGAGGSILTVPILVYAMGAPLQSATVTSLAIVGLNAAIGAVDQMLAAAFGMLRRGGAGASATSFDE